MTADSTFNFTVDKTNNAIDMSRSFNAELSDVWDAFTKPEILDLWGAPEPWTVKTKDMNFEVGGRRLYAMSNPEGMEHWSIQEFTSISPKTNFKMLTNFSDNEGRITSGIKSSENDLNFSESGGVTTVNIHIKYATSEVLQMMVDRGFKAGYGATMDNLEKMLPTFFKK